MGRQYCATSYWPGLLPSPFGMSHQFLTACPLNLTTNIYNSTQERRCSHTGPHGVTIQNTKICTWVSWRTRSSVSESFGVHDSNLGGDTVLNQSLLGFPELVLLNAGIVFWNNSWPPVFFIIHESSYHSTLYNAWCWYIKCKKFCEEAISYFPLIRDGPHRNGRLKQFFYSCMCILSSCSVFTESPLGNGTHRDRLMGRIYEVEMDSSGMIYIPSFINIGSGIQKLIIRDTQHGNHISLLLFFFKIRKGI
jgi:hypothetical protein